jgi:hypothetical protein
MAVSQNLGLAIICVTEVSRTSVATPMRAYNAPMRGSTGSSTSIREERRLADGEWAPRSLFERCVNVSLNVVLCEDGGRGDRDRDVDLEVCPDWVDRVGM